MAIAAAPFNNLWIISRTHNAVIKSGFKQETARTHFQIEYDSPFLFYYNVWHKCYCAYFQRANVDRIFSKKSSETESKLNGKLKNCHLLINIIFTFLNKFLLITL